MTVIATLEAGPIDAVAMLTVTHDRIKSQFNEFRLLYLEGAKAEAEKVARSICREWTIHTTIEEEIFYPEAHAAIGNGQLAHEANADRAMARELIAQILDSTIEDDRFAARVSMLGEYVNQHIREEQEEVFPQARRAGLDMDEIGARLRARGLDLEAQSPVGDGSAIPRGARGCAAICGEGRL